MRRFGWLLAASLALPALLPAPAAAACDAPAAYMEVIEAAREKKRSVTFILQGQSLPVLITRVIDECTVEGRNQQHDRIIIRLNMVAALAS